MPVTVPSLVIYKYIYSLVKTVRDNYVSKQATPEDTYLWQIFGGMSFANVDYFNEAVDLLTRTPAHPKHFVVRLSFDRDRAQLPTAHVTMAEDRVNLMGIGSSESAYINSEGEPDARFQRFFDFLVEIVVTSDNKNEIIIIYELIKAFIPTLSVCFAEDGVYNVKTSGKDVVLKSDLVPKNLFMRTLQLTGHYSSITPSLDKQPGFIKDIFANGEISEIN